MKLLNPIKVALVAAITTFGGVTAPDRAEAFQGYFGFSSEACYNKLVTQLAQGSPTNPTALLTQWFLLGAAIENTRFWAETVCEESDVERTSDSMMKAAWVGCVARLGSSTSRSRLNLSYGNVSDPMTSANLWPYRKSGGQPVRRNQAADRVLRDATGGLAYFVGSTHHPSRVLTDTQINQMLSRCGYSRSDVAAAAAHFFLHDD